MEIKTRLLCKSNLTYFSTDMPVYFYGMPNGKIYCFYARFSEIHLNYSVLESYADAHTFLNTKAQIMRRNLEMEFV